LLQFFCQLMQILRMYDKYGYSCKVFLTFVQH